MKPKVIITTIIVLTLLLILFQNTQVVTVRLFFWKVSMSQIILISLTLLIGFVSGFIVTTIFSKRRKKR